MLLKLDDALTRLGRDPDADLDLAEVALLLAPTSIRRWMSTAILPS